MVRDRWGWFWKLEPLLLLAALLGVVVHRWDRLAPSLIMAGWILGRLDARVNRK